MTDRTTLSRGNQSLVERAIVGTPLEQVINLSQPNAPYIATSLIQYYIASGDLARADAVIEYMNLAKAKLGVPTKIIETGDVGVMPGEGAEEDEEDDLQ